MALNSAKEELSRKIEANQKGEELVPLILDDTLLVGSLH